jgi:hypothetical protein
MAIWFTPLALMPHFDFAFILGQADPIIWALFLAAIASNRGRGPLLAAAAFIKPFMLFPLIAVLLRDRKQIPATIAASVLLLGVGVAVCGTHSFVEWGRYALPVASKGTFDPDNISLTFALFRLIGYPAWAHAWLSSMALLAPLIAIVCARRLPSEMQSSLVAVVSVLSAPICWTSYLAIALALVAIAAGNSPTLLRRQQPGARGAAALPQEPQGVDRSPAAMEAETAGPPESTLRF